MCGRVSSMTYRDHPRVCGEHVLDRIDNRRDPGSSPRMRGTLIRILEESYADGIIPAYAGNTSILR